MVGCRECRKKVGPMFRSNSEGLALCLGLFCYIVLVLKGLKYSDMKFEECQTFNLKYTGMISVWATPLANIDMNLAKFDGTVILGIFRQNWGGQPTFKPEFFVNIKMDLIQTMHKILQAMSGKKLSEHML